jgi:hypothetical protein
MRTNAYNNGYQMVQVTLAVKYTDGTEGVCVESAGGYYVAGSSSYPSTDFLWTIDPSVLSNASKSVDKIRVVLRYAAGTTPASGKTYIKDVVVAICGVNGGVISAGKIQSIDGSTYFDLDKAMIQTKSGSIVSKYASGAIEFYYNDSNLSGRIQSYSSDSTNTNRSLQIQSPTSINMGIGNTLYNYDEGINIDKTGVSVKKIFNVGSQISMSGTTIASFAVANSNNYAVALGYFYTGVNAKRPCVNFNHETVSGILHMRSDGGLYWNDHRLSTS